MDRKLICLDTSILIDYFRKQRKGKTFFFELAKEYAFALSVVTKLEIFSGVTDEQTAFWQEVFCRCQLLPLGEQEIDEATRMIKTLRSRNHLIELPDILIAATALVNKLELATLNKKHFERIDNLQLILRK